MMATHEVTLPIDPIEDEATEIDTDCRVCLGPCNKSIHFATLRVRTWFRDDLMRRLEAPAPKPHKPREFEPVPDQEPRTYKLGILGKGGRREDVTTQRVAAMKGEGLTLRQIATACKCSMNAVRDRLQRAAGERDRERTGGAA